MTARRLNLWCWTAAAAFAAGAVAAVAAAVWLPYNLRPAAPGGVAAVIPTAPPALTADLTMADFEPYLAGGLGRPDTAPPAVLAPEPVVEAPAAPAAPQDGAGLQLLGTITESDNSFAAFQTAEGVEIKRVGETVAGARVVEISAGVAVMRQPDGQSLTLRVPPPPQG